MGDSVKAAAAPVMKPYGAAARGGRRFQWAQRERRLGLLTATRQGRSLPRLPGMRWRAALP